MAGIALVFVVLGEAGETEGIVAQAGVLHHLEQRLEVLVEILRLLAGKRIAEAHQRARGGHVQAALDARIQPGPVESLEVGALAPLDVDDLDPLAGADLVARGGAAVDPPVEARIRQRLGQDRLARRGGAGRALDKDDDRRRRVLRVDRHRRTGRRHDRDAGTGRGVRRLLAGAAPRPEEVERAGARKFAVQPDGAVGDQPAEAGGAPPCPCAQQAGGEAPVLRHADDLAGLPAFPVDQADDVAAGDP